MTIFALLKLAIVILLVYGSQLALQTCWYYEVLLRRCSRIGYTYIIIFYLRRFIHLCYLLTLIYVFRKLILSNTNLLTQLQTTLSNNQSTINDSNDDQTLIIQQSPQDEDVEESKSNVSFFYFIEHAC